MVSSWARTASAKATTMKASRAKVFIVETSIKREWAEFERCMTTESRRKMEVMVLNDDEQEVSRLLYHIKMVSKVKNRWRFRVAMVPFVSTNLAVY